MSISLSNSSGHDVLDEAVDQLLSESAKLDKKSPLWKEVVKMRDEIGKTGTTSESQSKKYEEDLQATIQAIANDRGHGKTMKVLEKLEPFFVSLAGVARLCEGLLQASPLAVGVVFAGARVLLQLGSKMYDCFDAILAALVEVGDFLEIYQRLSIAYHGSEWVRQSLVKSCKTVIAFWFHACKILSDNALKTMVKGAFRSIDHELKVHLRAIEADRNRVLSQAQTEDALLRNKKNLENLRESIVRWVTAGEDYSQLDPTYHLSEARHFHHPGTCEWIFDHPSFKLWDDTKSDSVLWYHGPPGCGKTIMSCVVAESLRRNGRQVIWFPCYFYDSARSQALNAFRFIALQLLRRTQIIPDAVQKIYEEECANYRSKLTYHETLKMVVHELLMITERIHIIIDGLDECAPARRERLHRQNDFINAPARNDGEVMLEMIRWLVQPPAKRRGMTKWFFSSRREGSIESTMTPLKAITISPSAGSLQRDITKFLSETLKANNACTCRIPQLAAAADGNFQYAAHKANTLRGIGSTSHDEIEEELWDFPVGLTNLYIKSLDKLSSRSENEQELARRIIMVLVGTMQPLTLDELLEALAAKAASTDYSKDRLTSEETLQTLCGSFISIDRPKGAEDATVRLSHKSIQDLFFTDPDDLDVPPHLRKYFFSVERASEEMGRICMTYLQYRRYRSSCGVPSDPDSNREHAFLRYAAVFWFQHLNNCDNPSPDLVAEVKAFLRSPSYWTCVRVQTRTTPYLFTRFQELGNGGYSAIICGKPWSYLDGVPSTLPWWLDNVDSESSDLVREFHGYVKEWHEALSCGVDAVCMCAMDPAGMLRFPGRAKYVGKGIRRIALGPNSDEGQADKVAVDHVWTEKGIFKVRVVCTPRSEPHKVHWLCFDESPQKLTYLGPYIPNSSNGWVGINLRRLDVKIATANGTRTYPAQEAAAVAVCGMVILGSDNWKVVSHTRRRADDDSMVACHLTRFRPHADGPKPQAAEAGSSSSSFDWSNSSDDEDSSDEDSEDDEDDTSEAEVAECDNDEELGEADAPESPGDERTADKEAIDDILLISTEKYEPIWLPLGEINGRGQVKGAFHPSRPVFASSRQTNKLFLTDLTTKISRSYIFSEGETEKASSSSSLAFIQELHFAPDGLTLYCLKVNFERQENRSMMLTLALHNFGIVASDEAENDMEIKGKGNPRIVTYAFEDWAYLSTPLALTHWASSAVYVCIPLLTCSVKVLRLDLWNSVHVDKPADNAAYTLSQPIFIPSSASQRSPRLFYQCSPSKPEDYLYLLMDGGELDSDHEEANGADSDPGGGIHGSGPACVIRWTIDRVGGWKKWDPEIEGESEVLKKTRRGPWDMRGSFVTTEKTYTVPIRGALDWKRKSFLSCH